jgi:hypothetical protein
MLRWVPVALVTLSTGSGVLAQMADQEVMKAEQTWIEARRTADTGTLTKSIAEDFAQIATSGQMQDKKYATTRPASAKLDSRDLKVQVFGDTAVVTGIGLGIGAGEVRQTRVWQKQGGQWMLVFLQNTPIVPPPATPGTPAATLPPTATLPAPTNWPQGVTQDERDVLKVQRGLNDTFAKKDPATYGTMTADNFVRINVNGSMSTRAEFLKLVAATPDTKRVESNNSEFRFRAYGPIAVLTFVDKAVGNPAGNRMTRIFVKQGGAWKQLVTHQTMIQQP